MSKAALEAEHSIRDHFDAVVANLSREDYEAVVSAVLTHIEMVQEAIDEENQEGAN